MIKEAFKAGFVKEIVRQGYSPDRFDSMLTKYAIDMKEIMAGVGTGVGAMGSVCKGLMVGIPAVSALGGWALGSQDSVNKGDIKDLEQLATVHEYENAIKQMSQSDEAHGKRPRRKRVLPIAGQSTQSVIQPEMAKAAAPVIAPVTQPSPATAVPSTQPVAGQQESIGARIEKARQLTAQNKVVGPKTMKG